MKTFRTVALVTVSVIPILAIATGVAARVRESKVKSVKAGMNRAQVERLLGPGEERTGAPSCAMCPAPREQFVYEANPSLWYGHLADRLIVCYVNGTVCDTVRYGL